MPTIDANEIEIARQFLVLQSEEDWTGIVAEPFDEAFSEGLFAGTLRERIRAFVEGTLKPACEKAGERGEQVLEALHDEQTAHNVERFALVCGFVASLLTHQHWPAHEIAALVMLILSLQARRQS